MATYDEKLKVAQDKVSVKSKMVNGWYSELIDGASSGYSLNFKCEKVLYEGKSDFQDILVFKSTNHGNMLVLDGAINCCERDEFSYQEMAAFLPLNSHPNPENVLIIGGGDGGVAREVSKHPLVKKVTMCEIDDQVVEVSKKYLPKMAAGFDSPKLNLFIGDGFKFMKEHQNEFDVIITDSSDPIGPGEVLFKKEYYELMKSALREGGLVSSQGETMWIPLVAEIMRDLISDVKTVFPVVDYAYVTVPSYTGGQLSYLMCSKDPKTNFREPVTEFSEDEMDEMNLQYYHPGIHRASFVHAQFVTKFMKGGK